MDFHQLAREGKLGTIYPSLLTQENLTKQNNEGWTPLHWAVLNGHLNQIPTDLLTQENLTIKNNVGYTTLHHAAVKQQLNLIPYPILKQNFELIKSYRNIEQVLTEAKLKYTKEISNKIKKPTSTTLSFPHGHFTINFRG